MTGKGFKQLTADDFKRIRKSAKTQLNEVCGATLHNLYQIAYFKVMSQCSNEQIEQMHQAMNENNEERSRVDLGMASGLGEALEEAVEKVSSSMAELIGIQQLNAPEEPAEVEPTADPELSNRNYPQMREDARKRSEADFSKAVGSTWDAALHRLISTSTDREVDYLIAAMRSSEQETEIRHVMSHALNVALSKAADEAVEAMRRASRLDELS